MVSFSLWKITATVTNGRKLHTGNTVHLRVVNKYVGFINHTDWS